jgi:FAD/FMN-containing dehydrogenase
VNALAHAPRHVAEHQPDDFVIALRQASASRPAPPLRVLTAADAALAVRHAADVGLTVELGDRPADHALVLDLSGMKRIVIDPRKRTARVQPGVTAAELDEAVAPYGLVAAGLLTAQVVLQDGSIVRVSEEAAEPELGFVVDSTYRLHPAG